MSIDRLNALRKKMALKKNAQVPAVSVAQVKEPQVAVPVAAVVDNKPTRLTTSKLSSNLTTLSKSLKAKPTISKPSIASNKLAKPTLAAPKLKDAATTTVKDAAISLAAASSNAGIQLNKNEVTLKDLNEDQKAAIAIANAGQSFCLIGGAGSGKTTTVRELAQSLHDNGRIGNLACGTDKVLRQGKPAVAILSFTNQAVRNIKNAMHTDFQSHCSTLHNITEYHPEKFDVEVIEDGEWTGEYRTSMRFVPRYGIEGSKCESLNTAAKDAATSVDHHHANVEWFVQQGDGLGEGNILPHLDYIIIEEAGSVPRDLFYTLMSALPHPERTAFILLGDLNQLPPVFDDAILGFMLLALPIVELKTLYRNVGLVTRTAQRLLTGKPIRDKEATSDISEGGLSGTDASGTVLFKPYAKHVEWDVVTPSVGKYLKTLILQGKWDETTSVVLIPQNIKFGQIELNKWVGQGIAERDGLEVHHVTFNGQNYYYCLGDKVMYNKRYHRIVAIESNTAYTNKRPLPPSKHVDRWGGVTKQHEEELFGGMTRAEFENDVDVDAFLDSYAVENDEEGKVTQQASAIITLALDSSEYTDEQQLIAERSPDTMFGKCVAKSAGDISSMLPVNVMTVHKAQGSEWESVLLVLHRSHGKMLTRELLYTGMTRARKNLTVFYSGEDSRQVGASSLCRGILNQALKGITLDQKLDYFRNKLKVEAIKHELDAKRAAKTKE